MATALYLPGGGLQTRLPGCSIAVVHPGTVRFEWHESVLRQLANKQFRYTLISAKSGPLICKARNHVLKRFLEETKDDYLLFTDTDMMWEPEDVGKLAAHGKPVVSGLYANTNHDGTIFPVFLLGEKPPYSRATFDAVQGSLFEVAAVGMGFVLIQREVIARLGVRSLWPFEETMLGGEPAGEDVVFCHRARTAGFGCYVDPAVRVGHVKSMVL